MANLAVSPLSL